MKSVAEIAVTYAPEVLAGIFPFIRIIRGGRALTSFFLCWGLVIFWTFVFAIAPVIAGFVSTRLSHELDSWTPELYAPIAMVFAGWFPSSVTILLGLIFRALVRLTQHRDQRNGGSNTCGYYGGIILLFLLAAFGTTWFFVFPVSRPPREADLIQNFHAHRSSFEALRQMLQADQKSDRYLALLKEVGGTNGIRREGVHPEIDILMWAEGFGGDIVHVGICWDENIPTRQVENLDVYYHDHQSSGTKGWVYRHIDGNWYLFTDIATGY